MTETGTKTGTKTGTAIGDSAASYRGFSALVAVGERLAATASRLEKRALIVEYLRSLNLENIARGALYLAGLPFAQTDPRALNIGGTLLTRVVRELAGADRQAMHAAYLRHGDLGSAAYDLLGGVPERRGRLPQLTPSPLTPPQLTLPQLTLNDIEDSFAALAAAAKPAAKQRLTQQLLERATPLEAKYWIKIVLGDMRTGVKESLIEEAIAAAYEVKITQVRGAMMLTGNLAEVAVLAHRRRLEEARMTLFHPLGFMLASPVESVEEAIERFSPRPSADPYSVGSGRVNCGASAEKARAKQVGVEEVGSGLTAKPWTSEAQLLEVQIEDKYDGVRAQIHCGDPEQPDRVAVFSRSREDMTASFPEIVEAFAGFSEAVILDGEILAWSWGDGEKSLSGGEDAELGLARALPFSSLQPRLGRKRVTAGMRESTPVIFMAFDLLYAAGELMLDRPLAERRRALEELVRRRQSQTRAGRPSVSNPLTGQGNLSFEELGTPEPDLFARLLLAPAVQLKCVRQLEQAYLDSRMRGNEGVMLKARHSNYQPGRRGLAWLKLKRELATLDVVVTAAEYGHGRRAGTLSDYTFSVRDGDTLKVVGKAYSGLTDAEIAQLSQFFLEHTLEDFGSARSVEPLVILEVAFNKVMRSDRHDSGFALRFPRILRIRDDKPVSDIDTLARIDEIYRSQ